MAKRKGVLNAGLKALLASAETNAGIKFAGTFISEMAALPDGKQEDIAGLSQEQFDRLLLQSELATINAASAACDVKQTKALVENFADKALEMFEDVVELLRKELAFKNDQIGFLQGQIERSQLPEPSSRAHELAEQISDDAEPYALALKAIAEKRYDDARRYLAEAQDQKEADLAKIYSSRGETEIYTGNFLDAIAWYEKAINLAPDDRSIWESASVVYYDNAQYDKAEPLMRRTLAIDESSFGADHPNVARGLNNLALLLKDTNRLDEAETHMKRALEIAEHSLGPDHPNVATALNNLASLLLATNRLDEAETLMRRAITIDESSLGPNHPNVARGLNNLVALLQATNRLDEAEPLMRRVINIFEKAYGPDLPDVATALNNLAQLLQSTNRLDEAETLMKRALSIDESSFGPDHPNVAIRLNNLAHLLNTTNRLDEAESLMRRVINIFEKAYGPDHPNVATALNNLAQLLQATNRPDKAEPLMRRALSIDESSFGPDHPNVARDLNNLAGLLKATNRLDETEPLMKQVVEILLKFTRQTGHKHPKLEGVINNYRRLLTLMGCSEDEIKARLTKMK